MDIYVQVIRSLNAVYQREFVSAFERHVLYSDYNPRETSTADSQDFQPTFHALLTSILEYPAELLHIALYQWLLSKNMLGTLIRINKPSLETFLLHLLHQSNQSLMMLDLLSKHYERIGNYGKAAQVLNTMACKKEPSLTLEHRLEYVGLAVLNMRKARQGSPPYLHMILQDFEDKLDIGRVQRKILESVIPLVGIHPKAAEAVVALNANLYHISELYEKFADPLQLWECQLAIIDCADYTDYKFLENIWRNIFKEEISKVNVGQPNEAVLTLLAKIKTIAQTYGYQAYCFHLEYIIRYLEIISVGIKADKTLISKGLLDMQIPFLYVLDVYHKLFISSTEIEFWKKEGNLFHLTESIASLVTAFLDNQDLYSNLERREITARCQECMTAVLCEVVDKSNADDLLNVLWNIQFRLSKV